MLPYESYPPLYLSSSSPLSYSVRFENTFCSMAGGVERETPPSSSFLPSADFFGNYFHSMFYSYLLYSVNFRKTLSDFCSLVLTLLCLHICILLRKLTLLCCVLMLPLLFRLDQKFALHFGVLIFPLLYSICWKFALLYGFLVLPLLCRICKKNLIRAVLFLPLLYRLHQKFALNHGVLILPILCLHICRLIQKFSSPKVSLSFLFSPL